MPRATAVAERPQSELSDDPLAEDPIRRLGPDTMLADIAVQRSTRSRPIKLNVEDYDTDPAYMPVPGLLSLESVSFGAGHEIPLTITDMVLVDTTLVNRKPQVIDLVYLKTHQQIGPVLCRHIKSNNGVWQRGVTFWITGEWESDARPASSE
jgi:hypothetical protein